MDRSKELEEGKISSLLLKFAIPAIVGMMVNALYNIVDRIFIGHGVGSLGIAGITIGFPIMIVMMAFGMLIGIGATSLISIRLGEKKKEEAEFILGNAVVLLITVYAVISILGLIFLQPLLRLFGASEKILPYSTEYMSVILWGGVFQGIGFGMNNFIRAEGNPKFAMATMLIGAILNTILDPIFIFVFKMGIRGAAIATIISQAVSAMWVLSYFLSGKSMLKIRKENLKIESHIVKQIFSIGSAPFAMQIVSSVLNIIFNKSLQTYGGDLAISAMGIINSITMMILMPIFGINQGAQPIIGYNYGAKHYDRVKTALKYAIMSATAVVCTGFILTRIFAEQFIALFNRTDKELIRIGSHGLRIFLLMMPVIGFQIVSSNYFQAVGKPKQAMFLSLSRQVILLIPALLILPKFFGLDGIWISGPVSDLGSSIITAIWLVNELKKLNEMHQSPNPAAQAEE